MDRPSKSGSGPFAPKPSFLSGLRARLVLLVFFAVVPSLFLIFYNAEEQQHIEIERIKKESSQNTRLITGAADQMVEGARQLLIALAEVVIQHGDDPVYVNRYLKNILDKFPQYATMGVADKEGNSKFTAIAAAGRLNFADRLWFKRACETRMFSLGEYAVGRISRKKSIHFSYPVMDNKNEVRYVNYIALDLDWFNGELGRIKIPIGSTLKVIDSRGIILARSPDPEKMIGKAMPEADVVRTILSQHQGVAEATGLDRTKRLYAFSAVAGTDNNMFVSVGIPRSIVFADVKRLLGRNILLLGLVASISIGAALVIANLARKTERELLEHREHLELLVKQRTAELEQANIKLLELDRLKSMFIASMSHELRTPLNSIIGFTGIMLMGLAGETTEEQKKQLAIVKNNSNHLLSLINDVIDVSKIEADKAELFIEALDMSALLNEARKSFQVIADNKGIALFVDAPEDLTAHSDERKVKQVVTNLIGNALKFTEKGSVRISARRNRTTGTGLDCIEVSVEDTGIGIREKHMPLLFTAFSQIREESIPKQEGTGLGLYLSKKIAGLLGGEISVESEFGKGSRFVFKIPEKTK
ncbi:MAG: hybrid sensor histidine kinase/response regulator [Nitrospirae bacterium]|nr:MAG: hybrid sensor histidine kinase/response regulator [Nitrospirota bacterium]